MQASQHQRLNKTKMINPQNLDLNTKIELPAEGAHARSFSHTRTPIKKQDIELIYNLDIPE